jgi:chromosome segregation ATPase
MKSRTSNLSEKQFSFNDDPSKMNLLRNSTTILERLETLEAQTMEQEQILDQKNRTIKQMEERLESVLMEKSKLEGLLNEIDEAENHAEFEEYKEKIELQFKEDLNRETEELRMKVGELEHEGLNKDLELEKLKKKVESMEEDLELKVQSIQNFEENFISRIKYESGMEELNKSKQKVSSLENTITFRDLKISELEAKVVKVEESRKKETELLKKKGEEKYDEAKKKWTDSKNDLKEQIKELTLWKNNNLRGEKVDPEKV